MTTVPVHVRPETLAMKFKEGGVPPSTPTPRTPTSSSNSKADALEVMRCEEKPMPPRGFKTQVRMSAGGKGHLLAKERLERAKKAIIIISDDEETRTTDADVTPMPRRSTRLLGVKRKNYVETTPEPTDFGGDSDWEDDRSPGSWCKTGAADDDEWPEYEEVWGGDRDDRGKGKKVEDDEDDGATKYKSVYGHNGCCPRCRADIADLRATLDRALDDLGNLNRAVEYIDRLMTDDYKFLNRNIRKLFAMFGELRRQGEGAPARACTCPKCRAR